MKIKSFLGTLALILCFHSNAQIEQKYHVVGTLFTIQSKVLNDERVIQVSLPEEYVDTDQRYPVLYILDGQRYFLHGVSLHQSFRDFKQTPEFIVVGISKNSTDRNRMYSANSQKYLEFIKTEVIDLIDSQFRTSEKRMLFGWAFGGGFVLETLITQPKLFDTYIAASPFPIKEKVTRLDSLLKQAPDFDRLLFFTSGTNEGVVKEGTSALNAMLANNAPASMNWVFRELEAEEHRSTPFTTLYHGIRETFEYYPELQFTNLEEFTKAGGLTYVYDYYQKRASEYGFSPELSDWTMFSITRNAIRANNYKQFEALATEFKKTGFIGRLRVSRACSIAEFYLKNAQYEAAEELFELLIEKHPTSERPLIGLGDTYKAQNKNRKAASYYKKAKKLSN